MRPSKKSWQVRGDGQAFLVKRLVDEAACDTLHVIFIWTARTP